VHYLMAKGFLDDAAPNVDGSRAVRLRRFVRVIFALLQKGSRWRLPSTPSAARLGQMINVLFALDGKQCKRGRPKARLFVESRSLYVSA